MPANTCDLQSCFLCKYVLPDWKEAVAVKKKTISFKKGAVIFKEGDPVEGIFFLTQGVVKVYKHWGEQRELIIRFAKAGDVLGLRGFWGKPDYPVSATCIEDASACYIPDRFLEATLQTNPAFTFRLLQLYAGELHKAEKRMRDLALMEVKGRIALVLLEIQSLFGTDDDHYIKLPVTRQDIASYAGTTYETVFKFFTDLVAQQIISTNGKRIRINDTAALEKFAS
jgi:cAMP-binding proteins - catabolite gene activator and regulatory subunit of cAMP-dependent protein kinases